MDSSLSANLVPTPLISIQSNSGPPTWLLSIQTYPNSSGPPAPAPAYPFGSEAKSPFTGSEAAYSIHSGLPAKLGVTDIWKSMGATPVLLTVKTVCSSSPTGTTSSNSSGSTPSTGSHLTVTVSSAVASTSFSSITWNTTSYSPRSV